MNGNVQEGIQQNIPQRNNNNDNKKGKYCCGFLILWVFACAIGITFVSLDAIESGTINYTYSTSYSSYQMSNNFNCGHNKILLSCDYNAYYYNYDICWNMYSATYEGENLIINRIDVDPTFNESYANLYFLCVCIGCFIPYIIITLIWTCSPSINSKLCLIKQKHKCFILCWLSMIASILAVITGINLYNNDNCTNGLQDYIESQVGPSQWNSYYEWDGKPTSTYGPTLIFMMINCGITFLFAIWTCQCILCPKYGCVNGGGGLGKGKKGYGKMRGYTDLDEGKEESVGRNVKRYGSAKAAKMSVDANQVEGI